MGITNFAVKYPVSVLMITLGVCLLGIISYNKLGTDLFPDLKNPSLYIELEAGERPPEEIEKQFVSNIESIISRQDGVNNVKSSCRTGAASITVEYSWDQDMDEAFLDLQRSMSQMTQNEDIESIEVTRYDANSSPVMLIALSHKDIKDMNELRKIAENYMRSELVRLEGVADIQLNGQEEAYVNIETDPYLLEAYDISTETIASKIQNLAQNVSGGNIVENETQYSIKGVNIIGSLEDIENIIVDFKQVEDENKTQVASPIYLKDIAKISLVNKNPENLTRLDGERCLSISIYKENKYNTVDAVNNIQKKLEEFKASMPAYEFKVINNQGTFINASIGEVKESAVLGIILAMIILYIFLRKINLTLIMSIAIPVSIIATFNLMYFNNLTINIMTLGGLALGAGMLIDNAIVVVENIYRHIEKGMSPKEASIKGSSEVIGAISSSTLTTIVVFLPIVYIQGAAGELFKEQAWTVSFSLLSSLFVAILLIPMLTSKFVNGEQGGRHAIQIKSYGKFVGKLLDNRKKVIAFSIILMCICYSMLYFVDMEFMPKSESKEFSVQIALEPGLRLEATDDATAAVEQTIKDFGGENIEWVFSQIGPSNTDNSSGDKIEGENQAEIKVKLKDNSDISAEDIIAMINDNFSVPENCNISYTKDESALQSILGTETEPVIIEIRGEDLDLIAEYSNTIRNSLQEIEGIYNVKTSMENGSPEVNISIDRYKSGVYGIDINTLTSQIKQRLNGSEAGKFDTDGESVDIEINLPEVRLAELENMMISQGEKQYRLGELAELEIGSAPKEILRNRQSRIAKVTALLQKGYTLSDVKKEINDKLSTVDFPTHYSAKISGEEEMRAESFAGLSVALLLSIILVYMVMASQFESLRHPFTILLTIPLAGVGSILAFLLTSSSLNMMAFIGLIMLAGIAVNNSILLVDATNKLKEGGMNLKEALMSAAQQRIRPILMTTLTTILALLPMTLGFGEGSALRAPMAIAVIGGLITSTIMTLVVIPCVYYVFDKKNKE